MAGDDDVWRDLSPLTPDITGAFLRDGLDAARSALPELAPVGEIARFGPPLSGIGKIVVHRAELQRSCG